MCLLISQPAGVSFSKKEIADYVHHNPDGFGLMYGDGQRLHLVRMVGTLSNIEHTYRTLAAGKRCVLHFRMTTHGDTNADNAHPYPITPDIAMAHNGVLSIGNPCDTRRSDTWHLIQYFISPIAKESPNLLFDPLWGAMLGAMIGRGNKLAFAHADGRIAVINAEQGVKHKGAWLSNTYAWSAPRPAYRPVFSSPSVVWDEEETDSEIELRAIEREAVRVYRGQGEHGLALWADKHPEDAAILLSDYAGGEPDDWQEEIERHNGDALEYLAAHIHEEAYRGEA
jgi:hypothetical protein